MELTSAVGKSPLKTPIALLEINKFTSQLYLTRGDIQIIDTGDKKRLQNRWTMLLISLSQTFAYKWRRQPVVCYSTQPYWVESILSNG